MKGQKKQKAWYSGKKKQHTLKSQVTVEVGSKRILATAHGEGRQHDFKVFKHSKQGQALRTEVELLGDGGYQGVAKQHAKSKTPYKRWRGRALTAEQHQANKALSKRRIVVEHVLRRLKVFRVLKGTYRHRRRRFGLRLNLICALYNLDLTASW